MACTICWAMSGNGVPTASASDYYKSSPRNNPQGASSGSYRVYRGGSWSSGPAYVRAAGRRRCGEAARDVNLGFRLVSSGQ